MNIDEYKEALRMIENDAKRKKSILSKEYAISNNTISIGDIIEDHIGRIKVGEIGVYYSDPPQCCYEGVVLREDGHANKKNITRKVYQSNIKQVLIQGEIK